MAGDLSGAALPDVNRVFYDQLWRGARLIRPERFNTWALVEALAAEGGRRLELGPGLRPRLPVAGTVFADISAPALVALMRGGGEGVAASLDRLPFPDGAFGLVAALDVLEHVAAGDAALAEIARVAAPGAVLLLSVPLHPAAWTEFDTLVGHHRRYEPAALLHLLAEHGFTVEHSAPSGMLPRSRRLVALGMWFLRRQPARALWWYNRVLMPLGLRRAERLRLQPGIIPTRRVAGVLLVCRKQR